MKAIGILAVVLMVIAGGVQAMEFAELQTLKFSDIGSLSGVSKGYVSGNGPCATCASCASTPAKPVEWVTIHGGMFIMGTDSGENSLNNAKPAHWVGVQTFEMSKTAVTVEQYAECVIKGGCTEPGTGGSCNWGVVGRGFHPINCVDWNQASNYAKFKGGRLPSESEWEYAATGGGKNQKYPWGNDEPTCDKTVMYGNGGYGCGTGGTMPVCSKPAGNTAQGLCDMAGNVWQWVRDNYQDSYKGAPVEGGAFEGPGCNRVIRGGSVFYSDNISLRADNRGNEAPGSRFPSIGFRLAR